MIVVIADDISGAAELAGVAHAWGLNAEVQTEFDPKCEADLIALDTDTRSTAPPEVIRRTREIAAKVTAARPAWIYKKTDSVLRGHVRLELSSWLEGTQQPRALIIPANPNRGRVVRQGHYFIQDVPLHKTVFSLDPEYPAESASVRDLLSRSEGAEVYHLEPGGRLPEAGIIIPDATCSEDLGGFATLADEGTLCAGAAEFFAALLAKRTEQRPRQALEIRAGSLSNRRLFVCGSAAAWPGRSAEFETRRWPVVSLAAAGIRPWLGELDETSAERLALRACAVWGTHSSLLLGLGDLLLPQNYRPALLVQALAQVVAAILQRTEVAQVLLEGGATASAVLRDQRWERLRVEGHFCPAVAALSVVGQTDLFLGIKPGSYEWPNSMLTGP